MFNFIQRLVAGINKTKATIFDNLKKFFNQGNLDPETLEQLKNNLIKADLGFELSERIIKQLQHNLKAKKIATEEAALAELKAILLAIIQDTPQNQAQPTDLKTKLLLLVGINGAGKTTSAAKLAAKWQQQGQKILLAAGDTFRAAAIDQLKFWAQKHDLATISQQPGADSASVIYDGLHSGQAKQYDLVIADTAGRLQTQANLMQELAKIARVAKKLDPTAPHEVWIVLDATIGQNALSQLQLFNECLPVTGIVLTKLDGTAKGGIIFSLIDKFKIPVKYIGVGEKIEDLLEFEPEKFIDSLLQSS